MKVLIVTTSYPAHDEDPSGHFVRAEARLLARAGHHVDVVAPLNNRSQSTSRDGSIVVHHVGHSQLFGWPGAIANVKTNPAHLWHVLPFVHAARKRIASIGQVDRAIGHWIIPAGVPLLLDHPAPLEVVAHGADVRLLCALPTLVRTQIVTRLLDRETTFRFVARASLQTLGTKLPPALERRLIQVSHVEPAAIEVPDVAARAAEIRHMMQAHPDGFVVAVGRLIELKRFDLAIAAAAKADVPIVIIGDGPLRPKLEQAGASSGARVFFQGRLDRTETLAWISASRVLVHPSRTEGAPTVVREARSLGVPVVATDVGDIATWAEKDAGIFVVDAQEEALVLAIKTAFSTNLGRPDGSSRHDDR